MSHHLFNIERLRGYTRNKTTVQYVRTPRPRLVRISSLRGIIIEIPFEINPVLRLRACEQRDGRYTHVFV